MLQPELQPGLMVKVKGKWGRSTKGWVPAKIVSRTPTALRVLLRNHGHPEVIDLTDRKVSLWKSRNPLTPTPPPSLTTVVPKTPPGSGLAVSLAQAFLDGATIDLSSGNLCVPIVPSPPPILREECLAAPTPPPPPPSELPPVPSQERPTRPEATSPKESARKTLTFDQKLKVVLAINAIRDEGTPLTRSSLVRRVAHSLPFAEDFLSAPVNLDRILESAEFPVSLLLDEPITLTKGTEIHKALQSLSDRLTRIERELGLQP